MTESEALNYQVAVRDFQRARRQAAMEQLMARLTGKSVELLSYDDVLTKLKPTGSIHRGLQEIPLDAIVGSVARYEDFTRSFLPKRDSDEERWARVRAAVTEMRGMSPIEVYQIGDVYFVRDGNHRVSVARQLGTPTISAYVTEVKTRAPLSVEDDPSELICKARYVDFLERTNLDRSKPQANLQMTFCGQYHLLLAQIKAQQRLLEQEQQCEVPLAEAAVYWYEHAYLPMVRLLREQGVLRDFPERTETDLYVLLSEHREELAQGLGWDPGMETAVAELAERSRERPRRLAARVGNRLRHAVVPAGLESGPAPGAWRKGRLLARQMDRLFADIIMGVRGAPVDWEVLAMTLDIARRENGRLHGLHVVEEQAQVDRAAARQVKRIFEERCHQAGVPGELTIEAGEVARTIIRHASRADLVVVNLVHPPGAQPLARLSSGLNVLIQRCPRPILAVPGRHFRLEQAVLAYDGSPKADEALFVATYLALRWQLALAVVTVETEYTTAAALERARDYLEGHGVQADYVVRQQAIAEAILETAAACDADLLIMGGFGFRPVLHLVLGSTVDQMLREFKRPILICR